MRHISTANSTLTAMSAAATGKNRSSGWCAASQQNERRLVHSAGNLRRTMRANHDAPGKLSLEFELHCTTTAGLCLLTNVLERAVPGAVLGQGRAEHCQCCMQALGKHAGLSMTVGCCSQGQRACKVDCSILRPGSSLAAGPHSPPAHNPPTQFSRMTSMTTSWKSGWVVSRSAARCTGAHRMAQHPGTSSWVSPAAAFGPGPSAAPAECSAAPSRRRVPPLPGVDACERALAGPPAADTLTLLPRASARGTFIFSPATRRLMRSSIASSCCRRCSSMRRSCTTEMWVVGQAVGASRGDTA